MNVICVCTQSVEKTIETLLGYQEASEVFGQDPISGIAAFSIFGYNATKLPLYLLSIQGEQSDP